MLTVTVNCKHAVCDWNSQSCHCCYQWLSYHTFLSMKKPALVFSVALVTLLQSCVSERPRTSSDHHKLHALFKTPRLPGANIHLTILRKRYFFFSVRRTGSSVSFRNTTNTTQPLSPQPTLKKITFNSRRPRILKMKPIKDQVRRPKVKKLTYAPRKNKSKYSIKFRNILHRSKMGRFQKNINEATKKKKLIYFWCKFMQDLQNKLMIQI